jgi:hypothetical protein
MVSNLSIGNGSSLEILLRSFGRGDAPFGSHRYRVKNNVVINLSLGP